MNKKGLIVPTVRRRGVHAAGLVLGLVLSAACSREIRKEPVIPPPNAPAAVSVSDGLIRVLYNERTIFEGRIETETADLRITINHFESEPGVSSVLALTAPERDGSIRVSGSVQAGPESFACEVDGRDRGLVLVRHSSGPSRSLLNRAVYDRGEDWVFSVDADPRVRILPLPDNAERRIYEIETEGREIVFRFRPRYYQVHRGLAFFEPWTYRIWPDPVAGWVSWFAFWNRVTEDDILETAEVLSEILLPFGFEVLQIDDGYQRGQGLPELWLEANDKFPRGLAFLAGAIKAKSLKPGIWTNTAFNQEDFAREHRDWFVLDGRGNPARGNWIDLSLDASNPAAVDAVVRPVYRGLREMGWEYYKLDALRHLRYEGYNAHAAHFDSRKTSRAEAFRSYVRAVREEIGRGHFLLGCWGIRPELVGLIDGCRIGTDGFSYAGLAQFNSWNNVVWRNDPDHIELDAEGFRSALVTSLTGSLFLLTDKPSVYRTAAVEPAKRTVPVLWTRPGQIFDVDPSRSVNIGRADTEVSGSGPRVFDAGLEPACDLFLLEIDRPYENWTVLGRTGENISVIPFDELGLDRDKEYYVYEFWEKKFLGAFKGGFEPGAIRPEFKSQAFCIREKLPRPQLVATSRHVTCGGVDILNLAWKDAALAGRSRLTAGDVYEMVFAVPEEFRFRGIVCDDATVLAVESAGPVLKVRLFSNESREVSWTASFSGIADGPGSGGGEPGAGSERRSP